MHWADMWRRGKRNECLCESWALQFAPLHISRMAHGAWGEGWVPWQPDLHLINELDGQERWQKEDMHMQIALAMYTFWLRLPYACSYKTNRQAVLYSMNIKGTKKRGEWRKGAQGKFSVSTTPPPLLPFGLNRAFSTSTMVGPVCAWCSTYTCIVQWQ